MIAEELFRKTLAAAYDLHRHRESQSHPAWLARVLAQTLGCDSALLVTVDVAQCDFRMAAWPSDHFQRVDHLQVARLHAAEHPFVAHCAKSRSARAFRLSDLAPREQFQHTGLYRNLYRFLGIEFQLLMLVASPDAYWRAVVLNRRSHEFSDAEQLALEALWPHIMLAQRNLRRGARLREPDAIEASATGISGVVVVPNGGSVTLCSEQARIWLAEYFGASLQMRGVILPAEVSRWARHRVERESQGMGLRVERRDPLVITRDERCLVLDINVDHGKDMHLVTLEEVVLNAPPSALEALGLTPREAEVLSWVAQGKTNREVGLILGSSARTVQKHLEHIFEKLGVESRTAAILRAWQSARFGAIAASGVTRPSTPH
jgi:DNA-binding CsgD family transcriptional regulator